MLAFFPVKGEWVGVCLSVHVWTTELQVSNEAAWFVSKV